ncbi:MAG TPA: diguanylate cyclase, partial [Ferrovibrio sp.]|uniref:diguanylate cyclase n=1 Tax=Ferrovibrio sp. TaxID=1917215 RepID=UPI002ED4030E
SGGDIAAGVTAVASGIRVTVSAGVAECVSREQSPADVIKAADEALYKAKHAGRNRVQRAAGVKRAK